MNEEFFLKIKFYPNVDNIWILQYNIYFLKKLYNLCRISKVIHQYKQ